MTRRTSPAANQRGRDDLFREAIPERLNRRPQSVSLFDALNEFAHHGIRADAGDTDSNGAGHQYSSGIYRVARAADHGHAFARDWRFVDSSLAGYDHPSTGIFLPARATAMAPAHTAFGETETSAPSTRIQISSSSADSNSRMAARVRRRVSDFQVLTEIQQPDHDQCGYVLA